MNEISLRERIRRYMRNHHTEWIAKGTICDLAREATGATGEHTGRRLRELHEDGYLERKLVRGHAHYRLKQLTLV